MTVGLRTGWRRAFDCASDDRVVNARLRRVVRNVLVSVVVCLAAVGDAFGAPDPPMLYPPSVSGTTVTLMWSFTPGSFGIFLEAGSASGLSNLANLRLPLQSFYRSNSVPRGTYYVRVRAYDLNGISGPSNEVVIVTGDDSGCSSPPLPPSLEYFSQFGERSVSFHYGPNRNGCPATSYLLEAGTRPNASDVAAIPLAFPEFAASVPVDGWYYVRLRSVNSSGASAPSADYAVAIGRAGPMPFPCPACVR